jgi:hypothetical protein
MSKLWRVWSSAAQETCAVMALCRQQTAIRQGFWKVPGPCLIYERLPAAFHNAVLICAFHIMFVEPESEHHAGVRHRTLLGSTLNGVQRMGQRMERISSQRRIALADMPSENDAAPVCLSCGQNTRLIRTVSNLGYFQKSSCSNVRTSTAFGQFS